MKPQENLSGTAVLIYSMISTQALARCQNHSYSFLYCVNKEKNQSMTIKTYFTKPEI